MARMFKHGGWMLMFLLTATLAAGCIGFPGAPALPPIPVPAWVPDEIEQRAKYHNDFTMPIMPSIPPGYRPTCEDAPDMALILRAMPRVTRGIPGIYEEFRDDIRTNAEKLVDHLDPPRFVPLVGLAQLHHCHWQCTVRYLETIQSGYPFPFQIRRQRLQVIYIDRDHWHRFVPGQAEMTPDERGMAIQQ